MHVFRVQLPNRVGELARVSGFLADAGVNVDSVACFTAGGQGWVELGFSDARAAEEVLRQRGVSFSRHEYVTVTVPDEPGQLHRVSQALADRGINIEALYIGGASAGGLTLALWTDRQEEAGQVLRDLGRASPGS